jgi:hypothetical protein
VDFHQIGSGSWFSKDGIMTFKVVAFWKRIMVFKGWDYTFKVVAFMVDG